MQINLPSETDPVVRTKAEAAGFGEDIAGYVASLILSDEPLPPLSEAERQSSEQMIRRGEADIAAGRTQDMREALLEIGAKRGFTLDE